MSTQTVPAVVPNFDDEANAGRKLAIICSKGNLDMAYPGLILANAALGEGVETHLFFTFWGFDMILKSRMNDLKFSPVGNTAMHMPVGDMRVPASLAPVPGMQAMATKMMKHQIAGLGVPEVPEFLEQIVRDKAVDIVVIAYPQTNRTDPSCECTLKVVPVCPTDDGFHPECLARKYCSNPGCCRFSPLSALRLRPP